MINIDELIKQSIKEQNNVKTKVYRNIKAEILKFKTAKNFKVYDDAAEIQLLKKLKSQYDESIEAFVRGHRDDLADSERQEVEVINSLLPTPVEANLIESKLVEILKEDNLEKIEKQYMGFYIKKLKSLYPINDGAEISNIVKKFLV
jgi:uncharacterized protein YqeY